MALLWGEIEEKCRAAVPGKTKITFNDELWTVMSAPVEGGTVIVLEVSSEAGTTDKLMLNKTTRDAVAGSRPLENVEITNIE